MHTLSDEVKSHTVDQFIKSLDPSKTLFLASDAAKLKKDIPPVFNTMKAGNCAELTDASRLLIARAQEDEAFVKTFLGKDYKLDETVQLVVDPEKRGYAKTPEERQALLKKMVHFQISNYLIADMKLPDAKKQLIHRYELLSKSLKKRMDEGDMVVNYAEAFATALDPHSSFMSQETMEDFQIQMQLSLEGIGASLSTQDGFTVIEDLIPGGGAEKLNLLRPKDKIIAVSQAGAKPVPVMDMDLRDVVRMIRGKKGTKVTLTILRQGEKTETFDVTINRDKIDIKEQAAKISYQTREENGKKLKIGVLDLPSFYGGEKGGRSGYADVKKLLEEAKKNKVDGIVLDLSRNGGGLLEDAVRISGLFVKRGGIVATKNSANEVEVLEDKDEDVQYNGPLVVLITRLSASASEILSGALKDYKRALIVGGDHTFGKGTVQALSGLPANLGGMKVTTGMFFLPGGNSTQHAGVHSDILVPSIFNNEDVGEKTMDYSLAPQKVAPFLSPDANTAEPAKHWNPVDEALVTRLAAKSKDRVAKDPKFAELKKELEDSAKNKDMIKISDIRKKAEKSAKKDGKKAEQASRKDREHKFKDLELPFVNEGVNIVADWAASLKS
ncbi:MAG: PDZ domain-containing protein [Methylotenera sp.]|nr:PDZ domain-containing protein [Oligoflexia bacterium]